MIKMHGVKWIFRSFNGFSLRYGSVQCQFCRQSFLIVCYNVANCLRTYTIIKNIREEKKINKQVHIYFKKRTKSCSFRFNLRYYIYIYIFMMHLVHVYFVVVALFWLCAERLYVWVCVWSKETHWTGTSHMVQLYVIIVIVRIYYCN